MQTERTIFPTEKKTMHETRVNRMKSNFDERERKARLLALEKERLVSQLEQYGGLWDANEIKGKIMRDDKERRVAFKVQLNFRQNQSGFLPGDSCISQLLSITDDIYKAFDGNPSLEARGVFLDMSKAFDKVWHEGLLHKLKCYGVEGKMYELLKNFLNDRKQLCSSKWSNVLLGKC